MSSWRRLVLLVAGTFIVSGCLWEPEIEDQWTRVDLVSANRTTGQSLPSGTVQPFQLSTTVTYRSILTGFAVAELRATSAIPSGSVVLGPDAPREPMALAIDRILQTSVPLGRATRAVTGWDHLIQPIDFNFNAWIPSATDSTGAPVSLFLLCYLGAGQEIERQGQADTLLITPFASTTYRVLPVGLELGVAP